MAQRIETFLADVLALAGEELDVVRDEVRVALGGLIDVELSAILMRRDGNRSVRLGRHPAYCKLSRSLNAAAGR